MATASFAGINIPYVSDIDIGNEFIGSKRRTAGGKLKMYFLATKRQWQIQTRPLTKAEALTITSYLRNSDFAPGEFHLDEFGEGVTVTAIIDPDSLQEKRIGFRKGGTWNKEGRQLSFTVIEV